MITWSYAGKAYHELRIEDHRKTLCGRTPRKKPDGTAWAWGFSLYLPVDRCLCKQCQRRLEKMAQEDHNGQ